MITETFYLSETSNIQKALDITGLDLDELESIVGYFAKHSWRAGQMRGEVLVTTNGTVIRHHFTKKVLWQQDGV